MGSLGQRHIWIESVCRLNPLLPLCLHLSLDEAPSLFSQRKFLLQAPSPNPMKVWSQCIGRISKAMQRVHHWRCEQPGIHRWKTPMPMIMDMRLVDRVHNTGNHGDMMLSELSQSQKTNTAGLHWHEVSKIFKHIEPQSSRVVARSWRDGELLFSGCRVAFTQDEEVPETCWATLSLEWMLLSCALRHVECRPHIQCPHHRKRRNGGEQGVTWSRVSLSAMVTEAFRGLWSREVPFLPWQSRSARFVFPKPLTLGA